ncbi:MAG: hypothetical protein SGJ02_07145 [bacterium]|nr:hypothetical protein [bacterium]
MTEPDSHDDLQSNPKSKSNAGIDWDREFCNQDVNKIPTPRELFLNIIPDGREVAPNMEVLSTRRPWEVRRDRDAVLRLEPSLRDFSLVMRSLDLAFFMKGKNEWEENSYNGNYALVVKPVSSRISSDSEDAISLLEVTDRKSSNFIIPPWQLLFPGAISDCDEPIRRSESNKKIPKIKVAEGISFAPDELILDTYEFAVSIIVEAVQQEEFQISLDTPTGDNQFNAFPIYSSEGWIEALDKVREDFARLSQKGFRTVTFADMTSRHSSFLSGYMMVTLRGQEKIIGSEANFEVPTDMSSFRMSSDDVLTLSNIILTRNGFVPIEYKLEFKKKSLNGIAEIELSPIGPLNDHSAL